MTFNRPHQVEAFHIDHSPIVVIPSPANSERE